MTNEFEDVRRKAEDAWVPKLTAEPYAIFSVLLTSAFLLLSAAYIKLVEERELEEFWRRMQENVPFLVPRLRRA